MVVLLVINIVRLFPSTIFLIYLVDRVRKGKKTPGYVYALFVFLGYFSFWALTPFMDSAHVRPHKRVHIAESQ